MLVSEYNDVKESVAVDISEEVQRDIKPKEKEQEEEEKKLFVGGFYTYL